MTTTYVGKLMTQFAEQYRSMMRVPSLYEMVLRCGKEMVPERLTIGEARYIAEIARRIDGVNSFQKGQCYMNSQRMVLWEMGEGRLQYCEGYVAWDDAMLPIDHAWLVLDGRKAVDLTLRAKSKTELHSYCGIVIPPKLLMAHQNRTRRYSPVIEGHYQRKVFPKAVIEAAMKEAQT